MPSKLSSGNCRCIIYVEIVSCSVIYFNHFPTRLPWREFNWNCKGLLIPYSRESVNKANENESRLLCLLFICRFTSLTSRRHNDNIPCVFVARYFIRSFSVWFVQQLSKRILFLDVEKLHRESRLYILQWSIHGIRDII